jgi:trehalose-phosphatase
VTAVDAPANTTGFWRSLVSAPSLAIVTDLDGTLVPFAARPEEAMPGPETVGLLRALSEQLTVVVASGRPRLDLELFLAGAPRLVLVAEHGAWLKTDAPWQPMVTLDETPLEALAQALARTVGAIRGVVLERKTWGVAVHTRAVASAARGKVSVAASALLDDFVARHPDYQKLFGSEVLELRPAAASKKNAIDWLRKGGAGPIVALGDDPTDEDMFRALGPADAGVRVGGAPGVSSAAAFRLPDAAGSHELLAWVLAARRGAARPLPAGLTRAP